MSRKTQLFLLSLSVVLGVGSLVILYNQQTKKEPIVKISEIPLIEAQALYRKRAVEGMDFSSGPCLTNDLQPGWVVDIVHTPRERIDDLPENQCPAYRGGRATHYIELDQKGNFVRAKK